ncbi:MAG: VCBS repeat-containing protein [Ignavibacteria bacterium]|nr:VCBS repeat-containing protein [Ignavibacteria bacterium]
MRKLMYFFAIVLGVLISNISFSQVTFTDLGVTMGVADPGAAQGVTFVDVNNDGFLDIFLVNNNTPSKLWINNGGTGFTESSAGWGVNITAPTRGISCGDFDNDGFVDAMIGNWQQNIMLFKNSGTAFTNFTATAGVLYMSYGGSINWFDFNNDGKLDVLFANNGMPPRYNYFFRNDNLMSFTEVALSVGLNDSSSTLALASGDYDNDGDLDMFLGTQSNPNSLLTGILYQNNGNGTFTDVTQTSGVTTDFYTWGAEWGDYNNDGWLDLYLASTTGFNQLYKNNGNGTFTEVSMSVGLNTAGSSYSCSWFDYDNDGDLDLYVARGQNNADNMFRNDGGIFTDVASAIGMTDVQHSSAVSAGDFNNDGWVDLYVNNNGSANRLFKNNGGNSNNWVHFKLQGVNSNRSAIGSRVTVKTGSLSQIREVEGGSGGKGQNSLPLEFGLGTATVIDSVIVRWTNGLVQGFANVVPNTIYTVIEGQSLNVKNIGSEIPDRFVLEQNYPNPFNSMTNVKWQMAGTGYAKIIVYDVTGKEISELVNGLLQSGSYQVTFSADNLPSGVYFYKFTAGNFSDVKKMILIK